jgi:hypothetical protein
MLYIKGIKKERACIVPLREERDKRVRRPKRMDEAKKETLKIL